MGQLDIVRVGIRLHDIHSCCILHIKARPKRAWARLGQLISCTFLFYENVNLFIFNCQWMSLAAFSRKLRFLRLLYSLDYLQTNTNICCYWFTEGFCQRPGGKCQSHQLPWTKSIVKINIEKSKLKFRLLKPFFQSEIQ